MGKEQSSKRPRGNTGVANGRSPRCRGPSDRHRQPAACPAVDTWCGWGHRYADARPTRPRGHHLLPPPRRARAHRSQISLGRQDASGGTARGPWGRVVFHPLPPPRALVCLRVRPLPVPAAPARARPPSPNRPDGVSSGARADATTACAGSQFFSRLSILLAPEGTA